MSLRSIAEKAHKTGASTGRCTDAFETTDEGAAGCAQREPITIPEADYSPSFDHMASTLALVARSISIIAGHGRSNPSAFHLRVASMPIFEP
jgi:hypothetical protein